MHSHCVLLDLVYFLNFTKYTEEPKMQSSRQCSKGKGSSLGALPLRSWLMEQAGILRSDSMAGVLLMMWDLDPLVPAF